MTVEPRTRPIPSAYALSRLIPTARTETAPLITTLLMSLRV